MLDILVIDDDPMIGKLLQGGLDPDRFSLSVTDSALDAIAMCESTSFDFVILDYRMPGRSGLEVADTLRRRQIPFLILSAYTDEEIAVQAARHGAQGYLVKPVTPRQVELAIDTALARVKDINHLARAAEVSGVVGVAVGLVMAAFGISRMEALVKLRGYCRPRNQTLRDVSLEITNLFELRVDAGSRTAAADALKDYLLKQAVVTDGPP